MGATRGLIPLLEKAATTTTDDSSITKPVVGSWLMLPGLAIARFVAGMGYDFVLIDCEHGNIDDSAMHTAVVGVASCGVSPIIRIPSPEPWLVKRSLDTGAHGIMCPMIETVEQAKALVQASKFPSKIEPSGVRGVGSPFAGPIFKQNMGEYISEANQNLITIVQIESKLGLENCAEIAQVEGIDMLFIGPNDLCSSMGYSALDHENIPQVQEAIERILKAAKDAGKFAGMFCTSAAQIEKRAKQGFHLMNLGADIVAIGSWMGSELAALQQNGIR